MHVSDVQLKIVLLVCPPLAIGTLEGLFPRVDAYVDAQVVSALAQLPAKRAEEGTIWCRPPI